MSGGGIRIDHIKCDFLNDHPSSVYAFSNKIITNKGPNLNLIFCNRNTKNKDKSLCLFTANFGCVKSHHHSLKIFGSKATFLKEYDN